MGLFSSPLSPPGSLAVRINNKWTVILLLVFGIVALWLQIYREPMICWTPAHFTAAHVVWTNSHCWYSSQMFLRLDDLDDDGLSPYGEPMLPLVFRDENRKVLEPDESFTVYQWIPVILLFQALIFKLPDLVWKGGLATLGVSTNTMLGCVKGYENTTKAERKHTGKQIAGYLYHYLESCTLKGCPWGPLTLLYIFVKMLYFVNVITQFALMEKYLPEESALPWKNETSVNITGHPAFPKSVMCSFKLRMLQNVQRYQVACDIPINYWNHLIMEAVRVWLLVVMPLTIVSCLIDAVKVVIPFFRQSFMSCYLSAMDGERPLPKGNEISMFASYMGQDTVIMLKLIGQHTSDLLVGDTVVGLWDTHHGSQPGVATPCVPQALPIAPVSGMPPCEKAEYAGAGGSLYPKM